MREEGEGGGTSQQVKLDSPAGAPRLSGERWGAGGRRGCCPHPPHHPPTWQAAADCPEAQTQPGRPPLSAVPLPLSSVAAPAALDCHWNSEQIINRKVMNESAHHHGPVRSQQAGPRTPPGPRRRTALAQPALENIDMWVKRKACCETSHAPSSASMRWLMACLVCALHIVSYG